LGVPLSFINISDHYVALEQRGMESVQCLMEQARSAFGVPRILRLVDFEGESTTFDLGPLDPLGDLVYMMFLEKGIPRMSGGGGPIILGVPLSFVNISDR